MSLLPTPAVNDMGEGKTPAAWDAWTADMQARHGNGNGHGASLAIEALRLLPAPRTANNEDRQSADFQRQDGNFHELVTGASAWAQYAPAIRHWETILGRDAPPPTELAPRGGQRLSARPVEWMMGLPDGWVTDTPGITRAEALRCLGNGVVPQQCAAALRVLLATEAVA